MILEFEYEVILNAPFFKRFNYNTVVTQKEPGFKPALFVLV